MSYKDVEPAELAEVIAVWRKHREAETHEEEVHAKHEIMELLYRVGRETWDKCVDYAPHTTHERKRLKADNPYK